MPVVRSSVQAVLFDFGGVLSTSPFEAFARFERERGLPDGFLRRVNATNHHDNAWARLERSEIDVDEFAELFAIESEALGHRLDGREVLALLGGDLRPEMVTAVERCHERLKTGLLTNNFVAFGGESPAGDPIRAVMDHFDVIVESSRVGIRKPEPRFYELACDLLAIEPAEAVFLDDIGANLKPARNMGMHTIKVVDPVAALAELESVVGFPLG